MSDFNIKNGAIERYIDALDKVIDLELLEFDRRRFLGRTVAVTASAVVLANCKTRASGDELKGLATSGTTTNKNRTDWPFPNESFLADYYSLISNLMPITTKLLKAKNSNFPIAFPVGYDSLNPKDYAWAKDPNNKIYASVRGKLVGKLIATWLAEKPYEMFAELRNSGAVMAKVLAGISKASGGADISALEGSIKAMVAGCVYDGTFQPFIGPVLVCKNEHVIAGLLAHDSLTVDRYGIEMNKTMKGQDPEMRFFILGTDDTKKYTTDAKILKGSFDTTGFMEQAPGAVRRDDSDMVRKICEASVSKRVKAMKGMYSVTDLARYVPVDVIREYFGIEIAEGGVEKQISYQQFASGASMSEQYFQIQGDLADQKAKFTLPAGLEVTKKNDEGVAENWALTTSSPASSRKSSFTLPNEARVYLLLKYCFENFFNNVAQDEQVSLRSLSASFELLSLIAYRIDEEVERRKNGQRSADNTLLKRLVTMHEKEPENPHLSLLRIRENLFGIITGAIINQEEQTCRAVDALVDLGSNGYTSGRTPHFNGAEYQGFVQAVREKNNAQINKYFNEALRHRPQGEVLLRVAKAPIKLGAPINPTQVVFLSQGSAMQDESKIDQPDQFNINRPQHAYIHHGYGRHRCLGQYFSMVITEEILKGIFTPAWQGGTAQRLIKFRPMKFDEKGLYPVEFTVTL